LQVLIFSEAYKPYIIGKAVNIHWMLFKISLQMIYFSHALSWQEGKNLYALQNVENKNIGQDSKQGNCIDYYVCMYDV